MIAIKQHIKTIKMKTWKISVTLKVADSWIEDGFDASERTEEIQELLSQMLPYAYGHEFQIKAQIVSAPKQEEIKKLQGY